ncbi:N,N-dimethylformamidase beta subunit family domain-containing protein [Dactylosporangium sp. NPDC051485]|uniref:N,N-dimethylformamidase beta subunit family domain-containing protein n=1 Tax=Dactylosporangium sp. NPDC051485 TaxID=3154846 RepID=UPI00341C44A2
MITTAGSSHVGEHAYHTPGSLGANPRCRPAPATVHIRQTLSTPFTVTEDTGQPTPQRAARPDRRCTLTLSRQTLTLSPHTRANRPARPRSPAMTQTPSTSSSRESSNNRHGAGAWGDFMDVMKETEYTARFAGHWVYTGTGLRDGDRFALGAVGYETDAALYRDVDGVPRITGADGTPPSFVILATADLRHWRRYGQGGHATMGVFRLGAGTVFNAATVNWGNRLADPVVDRITRNVLDRLSAPRDPSRWDAIGPAPELAALVACEHAFWALTPDGTLLVRAACGQNLPWRPAVAPRDAADDPPVCLAAPHEAVSGMAVGLYAVTPRGRLLYREPVREPAPWEAIGTAPAGIRALAGADGTLFAITEDDRIRCLPLARLAEGDRCWTDAGSAAEAVSLTAAGGLLFAVDRRGRLRCRPPAAGGHGGDLIGPRPGRRPHDHRRVRRTSGRPRRRRPAAMARHRPLELTRPTRTDERHRHAAQRSPWGRTGPGPTGPTCGSAGQIRTMRLFMNSSTPS